MGNLQPLKEWLDKNKANRGKVILSKKIEKYKKKMQVAWRGKNGQCNFNGRNAT